MTDVPYHLTPAGRRARNRATLEVFLTLDAFVTSDSHWDHKNIGAYSGRPDDHFELMRERWIETVPPDELILHLGDLCVFGNRKRHDQWVEGLPGRKFLLLGNHDDHDDQWYADHGFRVVGRERFLWWDAERDRVVSFSHEPDEDDGAWQINVHGHVHNSDHHGTVGVPERRRNACVEVTDYRPVRLGDLLDGA